MHVFDPGICSNFKLVLCACTCVCTVHRCWLSTKDGVIAAFIGPMLIIILVGEFWCNNVSIGIFRVTCQPLYMIYKVTVCTVQHPSDESLHSVLPQYWSVLQGVYLCMYVLESNTCIKLKVFYCIGQKRIKLVVNL